MAIIDFKYTAPPTVAKFMRSDAFHRAIMGPIGSGKSAGMCVEVLRRCCQVPIWNDGKRSSRWAIIRNTSKELEKTTLKTWMDWMYKLGTWHKSDKTFWLRFADVEAEILFLPLDTPADIHRVLSLELTGAWVNEFREVPVPIFSSIKGRLKRYPNPKRVPGCWYGLIMDTNPPEIESDAYNLMEKIPQEEGNPNSIINVEPFFQPSGLSAEAENREWLADDYYEELAKGETKAWVDTYVHGKYSPSMSGKPVYARTFHFSKHVSRSTLKPDPNLPIIIGFDCGRTPAALFMQMSLDGRVRAFREAVSFDMGMEQFAKRYLRPIVKNFFPTNPLIFIGDPAGQRKSDADESSAFKSLKKEFRDDGAVVKAAKTNDPIVRIQAVDNLLVEYPEGEPLFTIDPSCKYFIDGLRSKYRYKKKKLVKGYEDRPEKNDWSHVMDGAQYGALFLTSGKYDYSDYLRITQNDSGGYTHYRPAQREGY